MGCGRITTFCLEGMCSARTSLRPGSTKRRSMPSGVDPIPMNSPCTSTS